MHSMHYTFPPHSLLENLKVLIVKIFDLSVDLVAITVSM